MSDDQPNWWRRNKQLRRDLGLPPYRPPRFKDETLVHCVVNDLNNRFNCTIRIGGIDIDPEDPWPVVVNGSEVGQLPRHRDQSGNIVYTCDSDRLRTLVFLAME